jgi:RND family efflux transporter MFP subunit
MTQPSIPAWGEPAPTDRRRRALMIGGATAAALLVAVGAFVGVSGASGTSGYRTAVVAEEDVERTLSGVGTIEPVSQASVAFPVSGTVAQVDVSVGSTVVAGQVLASLDTASLDASLHTAEASLAAAELALTKALNGEATASAGGGAGPSGGSASSGAGSGAAPTTATTTTPTTDGKGSGAPAPSSGDGDALVAARRAVADGQHQLDLDLAAAQAALAASSTACSTTPVSTTTTDSSTSSTVSGSSTQACQDALGASLARQQTVSADESALQQAVNQLDALLAGSSGTSGSSSSTSGSSPSGSSTTGGSPTSGGSASGSTSSVTSADLIGYQKAVDAAAAEVAVAQQSVAQATIVSPIDGTVTAIGLKAGDSVSSGSSTATIRISGPGGYEVTTSVSVTDLPHVAVGQDARVVVDGSTDERAARVVQISLVPNSATSSTSTTYGVVLALTDPRVDLPNGGLARTTIVTGEVAAATAVPTSAVTTTETGRTVTVLDGGEVSTVSVTVGTVGSTWTEITDGVTVGQTVVLADLSRALPGSATSSSSSSSGSGSRSGAPTGGFPSGGSFTPPSGASGGARPGQ